MDISIAGAGIPGRGAVVAGVTKDSKLTPAAMALDEKTDGAIRQAIRGSRFNGGSGQSLSIVAPRGTRLDRIVLLGLGDAKSLGRNDLENIGGRAFNAVANSGSKQAKVIIDADNMGTGSNGIAGGFVRCLEEWPGDDIKAEISECRGDNFLAAVMAILAHFSDVNFRRTAFAFTEASDHFLDL